MLAHLSVWTELVSEDSIMDTVSDNQKAVNIGINVDRHRKKKLAAKKIAFYYGEMGEEKKAKAAAECSNYLQWTVRMDGTKRLTGANFCRLRMCPMCSWYLAKKRTRDLMKTLNEPEHRGKRLIFITLTVKNCKGEELKDTINMMYKALRSLTQKDKFLEKRTLGMVKKLEVTYNHETDEYHPHFHILCEVEPSYFNNPNLYVTHDILQKRWKRLCKLDYDPIVGIQTPKTKEATEMLNSEAVEGAVKDVCKYMAKDVDYAFSLETFKIFDEALRGRRLYTPTGSIKKTMARLKMDEDSLDDNEDEQAVPDNPDVLTFTLRWHVNLYNVEVKRIETSKDKVLAGLALLGEYKAEPA